MTEHGGRILVIDDDRAMGDTLVKGLSRHGFEVTAMTDPHEAVIRLGEEDFDVLVTDLNMRGMGGLEVCERALAARPGLPVVVITAFGTLDTAIGAIRAGAYDFLTKPFDLDVAAMGLGRAVEYRRLRDDLRRLQVQAQRATGASELVGDSRAMQRVYDLVERLEGSDLGVLVTGESGTGKELVARALHRRSPRADGPFIAVNCAALPEQLLESELFGHVRGAFTDARTARTGLFLQAQGGTLFLDEVGELPPGMQPKLLRALQEHRVRPVGSDREVAFDARVIAATNRDLVAAVEKGGFREDLYFRLNVVEVPVPALRSRGNDILVLAQRFLASAAERAGKPVTTLDTDAAEKLLAYPWPGNVRELENCLQRAVALARFDRITQDDLPERIRDYRPARSMFTGSDPEALVPLEEVERAYVLRVLDAVGGHRGEAARILQLDRKTLYRKLERWGRAELDPETSSRSLA